MRWAERRQAARAVGRNPDLPRYFSGHIANEAEEHYIQNLASEDVGGLQAANGDLLPIPGIDT